MEIHEKVPEMDVVCQIYRINRRLPGSHWEWWEYQNRQEANCWLFLRTWDQLISEFLPLHPSINQDRVDFLSMGTFLISVLTYVPQSLQTSHLHHLLSTIHSSELPQFKLKLNQLFIGFKMVKHLQYRFQTIKYPTTVLIPKKVEQNHIRHFDLLTFPKRKARKKRRGGEGTHAP